MALTSLLIIRQSLQRMTVWRWLVVIVWMMLPFVGTGHYSTSQTWATQICSGATNQPLEQYPSPDLPLECTHDCGLCCASLLDLTHFPEIPTPLLPLMGIFVGLTAVLTHQHRLRTLTIRGPPFFSH
jgi:hypothetical protein